MLNLEFVSFFLLSFLYLSDVYYFKDPLASTLSHLVILGSDIYVVIRMVSHFALCGRRLVIGA